MENNALECTYPIPADILALLGPPPVYSDQAARVYGVALAKFAQLIKPRADDLIEWTYVKDLADHWSEVTWLRGLKARIVARPFDRWANRLWAESDVQIQEFYKKAAAELAREIYVLEWEPDGKSETERLLAEAKRNNEVEAEKIRLEVRKKIARARDVLDAHFFEDWIGPREQLEKSALIAEEKFENTLRRLDEYKHGFGERARKTSNEIIEGEFQQELAPVVSEQVSALMSPPTAASCAETSLPGRPPIAPVSIATPTRAEAPLSEETPERSVTTCADAALSEEIPATAPLRVGRGMHRDATLGTLPGSFSQT